MENKKSQKNSIGREIFEWVYTIVIAVVIAFAIKAFLFDIVKVDGSSMHPTLVDKERLIVTKLGYEPDAGDIVILDSTYKNREAYYDKLAEEEGKDELSAFSKFKESFSLSPSLKKRYYVKRIIALPGQTVDIKDGKVYIDGAVLDEPYYSGITSVMDTSIKYPVTVEEGMVFVMGDNRNHSNDSRNSEIGQINEKNILGKAILRIYPFNSIGVI